MKRSYLFLAVGALALSACTSESVLEDAARSHNAIKFENVVNKISRADLNSETMDHFNVYGYYSTPAAPQEAVQVFNNTLVKRVATGWDYVNVNDNGVETVHWLPNNSYYFYAYNCGNEEVFDESLGKFTFNMDDNFEHKDRVLKIENYLCDYTHQHDLVYASNTGATDDDTFAGILAQTSGNATVSLQFKHILTKVQAQFTSGFPADYEVVVSDVSIQNVCNIGSYDPTVENGWKNVDRKEGRPYVVLLGSADATSTKRGGEAAKTNGAYVIPSTTYAEDKSESNTVYIKFTVNVKTDEKVVFSKALTGVFVPNWKCGYTYTYNIEVSGNSTDLQAIAFTTATDEKGNVVTPWEVDPETGNPTITIDK